MRHEESKAVPDCQSILSAKKVPRVVFGAQSSAAVVVVILRGHGIAQWGIQCIQGSNV